VVRLVVTGGSLTQRPQYIGIDTHLFVKVSRPGDSEVSLSLFESSWDPFVVSWPRYLDK